MPTTERPAGPGRRGGVLASLSLEYKLPMLIGLLLLAVTAAMAVASYVEMRRATLAAASARLDAAAPRLRDLLRQSAQQLRVASALAANKPDVVEFARSGDHAARQRAIAALQYSGPAPAQVIAIELRDAADSILLSTAPGSGTDTIAVGLFVRDSTVFGKFHLMRDTLVYPAVSHVRGTDAAVVTWRRVNASRAALEENLSIVGDGPVLYLGNADSSAWSDLERGVPEPVAGTHVERIPGTPWAVGIAFARDASMAPVFAFLRHVALIGFGALVIGLIAAWFASRRVTTPLRELTASAGAIASGKFDTVPEIKRSDELGKLGRAFAAMATEISESRRDLESKVEARTRELNATLEQLREAQDALVRREKLAMLGQLAGGVGHELRNPLGVMTNAVYYLKVVLAAQPPTVHEYLDILQQQITLSEKIVGDLMDFARSKPPQLAPASLTEVTSMQLSRLGPTEGVHVETHLPADVPPVYIDRVQIGQVILNLLTNAVQAVQGSGTITVRVGANGDRAHVEVSDTGPGVPPENLERIFEPLFTTKARGIGLGLAVSRTLSRANGGELTVVSTPGSGATFRLELPTREVHAS